MYLAAFRGSPCFAVPIVDAQWHEIWASSWARGTWTMNGRAFFRAPLYPFWLSLIYRVYGLLWTVGWFSFPWGIIFPLAVTGAVGGFLYSWKRRSIALLTGWVVLYGVSLLPFFICARFRTAMVPPMILLAAWALADGRTTLLRPAPVVAGVVAFLIANNNLFDARASDPTQEAARWGVTIIAAGRLDEGCEALRAVIDRMKDEPRPPSYLGEFAYSTRRMGACGPISAPRSRRAARPNGRSTPTAGRYRSRRIIQRDIIV